MVLVRARPLSLEVLSSLLSLKIDCLWNPTTPLGLLGSANMSLKSEEVCKCKKGRISGSEMHLGSRP